MRSYFRIAKRERGTLRNVVAMIHTVMHQIRILKNVHFLINNIAKSQILEKKSNA